jgi:hypothetical protein
MYFEIQPNSNPQFTIHHALSQDLYLNTDSGWQTFTTPEAIVYFKGYHISEHSDSDFINLIVSDPKPKYNGFFVAIIQYNNGEIVLTTDLDRGTEIYYNVDNKLITNLIMSGIIHTATVSDKGNLHQGEYLQIVDSVINIKNYSPFENYLDFSPMTEEEVIDSVDSVIRRNFEIMLAKNKSPIKIFLSGGVDSSLTLAYLKHFTDDFKIINCEHVDFSEFLCKNWNVFKRRCYVQGMTHFSGPTLTVMGGWGDERMVRDPQICNLLYKLHGSTVLDEVQNHTDAYQYYIAQNDFYKSRYQDQATWPALSSEETYTRIYNINMYVQGWGHIEENIFFNPFKDLQITNYILRAPYSLQKEQFLNAGISKKLIERYDPSLLKCISTYKNKNSLGNLWDVFETYKKYT